MECGTQEKTFKLFGYQMGSEQAKLYFDFGNLTRGKWLSRIELCLTHELEKWRNNINLTHIVSSQSLEKVVATLNLVQVYLSATTQNAVAPGHLR